MSIDPQTIALITTTYYPDRSDPIQRVRARIAADAIRSAVRHGFSVIVVDGHSDPAIFSPMDLPAAKVFTTDDTDMVNTRQLAAALAIRSNDITHVVWTEPEKDIAGHVVDWIDRGSEHNASVIIPMRTHMESYPLYQQVSERKGNEDLAAVFEHEMGDLYFGPRVFRRDAVEQHWLRHYAEYRTDARQWAAIFSPAFGALAGGDRIIGVPVDFDYPLPQNEAETDSADMLAKRSLQRSVITQAAIDIRHNIMWSAQWNFELLDGFTLATQTTDPIDLTQPSSATTS